MSKPVDTNNELDEILDFIENYGISSSTSGMSTEEYKTCRQKATQAINQKITTAQAELLDRLEKKAVEYEVYNKLGDKKPNQNYIPLSAIQEERKQLDGSDKPRSPLDFTDRYPEEKLPNNQEDKSL